ncbi:hypothetical protein BO83DRAFT_133769 [Aspergillus eucalypticola CBS 122712]|uniref:Uncharacterized protein n=1 Tax=Aspergillus eucalypticola (strain CBS 122712 / IBT 29274) TaxID=1448314 RepID=A0A317WEH8_ASPEC|nr:uncharacterized protein BO83DRAFT_133769 [Aspergillus eucalypticola CBS 122712]PWY82630.1 hypothetical protein BO83DRAFT_133769 [Aspergillus eucalypticola CBS 122712]
MYVCMSWLLRNPMCHLPLFIGSFCFFGFVFTFRFLISNLILFLSFCFFFFCTDVGFPKSSQKFVAGEAVRCFSFIGQQYAGIWHAESKDAGCAPITGGPNCKWKW